MKTKIVTKISLWLVNITLGLSILLFCYIIYQSIDMMRPINKPDSLNGILTWSGSTSMGFEDYHLTKKLIIDTKATPVEREQLLVVVPSPKVGFFEQETPENFKLEGNEDISGFIGNNPQSVVYIVNNSKMKRNLIWTFIIISGSLATLLIYWLWVLRKFLINVSEGNIFIRSNVTYLIILSIPAFVLPLLKFVTSRLATSFFLENFRLLNGHLQLSIKIDPLPVIFGFVFLVMAGIIYEGQKLREEQELTI